MDGWILLEMLNIEYCWTVNQQQHFVYTVPLHSPAELYQMFYNTVVHQKHISKNIIMDK